MAYHPRHPHRIHHTNPLYEKDSVTPDTAKSISTVSTHSLKIANKTKKNIHFRPDCACVLVVIDLRIDDIVRRVCGHVCSGVSGQIVHPGAETCVVVPSIVYDHV